jgi:hypothetical protein
MLTFKNTNDKSAIRIYSYFGFHKKYGEFLGWLLKEDSATKPQNAGT